MAAYNITADPEYGDFMSLSPDSLRRKRIDQLADNIYASMYEGGRTPPRGQQRSSADTTAGRGDEARKVALKQAIAQEQRENAAAPTIASETVGAATAPDFNALDKTQGRAAAQDTAREADSFLPTAPAPTIASETTGAAKPTATGLTGDQLTQRILDQEAALAKEEASRPPLPAAAAPATGGNMMTPVGPVGAPAAQAMPDISTAPADEPYKSLLERLAPSLYRSADEDITGTTFPTVDSETSKRRTPTGKTNAELRQDILDQDAALAEEEASRPPLPTPTGKTNAELRENMLRQDMALHGEEIDARNRSQRPDIGGLPEGAVEVPDLPEAQGPGLLSRLGGFAQNNPELLAQIAQAGGGFMQNIAQGRAQKAADAKTRGAMAQSNLIGALTGGKSRPAVMREEAEQGGLLARLGQAVEAGGRVAGGEMQRRTALSQRGEEMGLERDKVENAAQRLQVDLSQAEAQKAYQGRMLELQKLGISNDLLIAQAKAGKKGQPPQKVYDAYLAANSVMSTVNTVEELMKDAGLLQAGTGLMLVRGVGLEQGLPQSLGGDKTREITAAVNRMVQTLGEDMSGILSNQDIVFLKQQAPSDEDSMSTVIKKADLIRKRIAESIRDRAGVDADYFDMTPFAGLIDSVAAQGEQAPGDLAETLGQTEIKL